MDDVVTQSEKKSDNLQSVLGIAHVVAIRAAESGQIDNRAADTVVLKVLADRDQITLNTSMRRRIRPNLEDPHESSYSVTLKENVSDKAVTEPGRSLWTRAQYKFLRIIAPREPGIMDGSAFAAKGKRRTLLEDGFLREIQGKSVIDFGCCEGAEAVEMALVGAAQVTGLDIQAALLE